MSAEALEWLGSRPIGVIATVGDDGVARAVPVEVVVRAGLVYAWCKRGSVKARNVARVGAATVVAYKGNDWVQVRGPARLITADDEAYEQTAQAFLTKYDRTERYGNDTLIEVEPVRVAYRFT